MTVYAPRTDITSIRVGTGCGKEHLKKAKDDGHFAISCAVCEPGLVEMGWSNRPVYTEQTPDEVADRERLEKQSSIEVAKLTQALAAVAKERVEAEAEGKSRR